MVAEVSGAAMTQAPDVRAQAQPWPARTAAYYGLFVIILATALNFTDAQIFNMLAQSIKADFHLTDEQLGFLLGPANIIFYVLVGIPLARLVDLYPRKYVLAAGITLIGGITALGGLAQNFVQLFMSRMLVGAGGSAHAPGSYSMLSDYFAPARLPRAIGFLQLGFIGGNALGIYLGGFSAHPGGGVAGHSLDGPDDPRLAVGAHDGRRPGVCDRGPAAAREGAAAARGDGAAAGRADERRVAGDLDAPGSLPAALHRSRLQRHGVSGPRVWRPAFLTRTYGWSHERIGHWLGTVTLVSYLLGALVGTVFTVWLAKRYKDSHVRAATILFALAAPFEIAAPLMPSGELALLCIGGGGDARWPPPCRRTPRSSSSRRMRCAAG